jgi:hypothetical protein
MSVLELPDIPHPPPIDLGLPLQLDPLDQGHGIEEREVGLRNIHGRTHHPLNRCLHIVSVDRRKTAVSGSDGLEEDERLLTPNLADDKVVGPIPQASPDELEE